MKLQLVSIRSKVYKFPDEWSQDKIEDFVLEGKNGRIRVCPICHKIDVTLNHFDNGICISQEHSKLH